jgi:hypothetical protein
MILTLPKKHSRCGTFRSSVLAKPFHNVTQNATFQTRSKLQHFQAIHAFSPLHKSQRALLPPRTCENINSPSTLTTTPGRYSSRTVWTTSSHSEMLCDTSGQSALCVCMPSARKFEFSCVMSTAVVNCVPGTHSVSDLVAYIKLWVYGGMLECCNNLNTFCLRCF